MPTKARRLISQALEECHAAITEACQDLVAACHDMNQRVEQLTPQLTAELKWQKNHDDKRAELFMLIERKLERSAERHNPAQRRAGGQERCQSPGPGKPGRRNYPGSVGYDHGQK